MTEEGERLARAESEIANLKEDVKALEGNQKWAAITIISLVAKIAFDLISVGLH